MGIGANEQPSSGDPVIAIYDAAVPQVYGYLLPPCGNASVAEDLTSETFFAAVASTRERRVREVSVPWLIGIARHKLADHWRRAGREARGLAAVGRDAEEEEDPWDGVVDAEAAHAALSQVSGPQRAALTLRYLDGLPVVEVAGHLGRSVRGTETLLVRARAALRRVYLEGAL